MGILTLFYGGLMDLAKVLLDPLDNDHYHHHHDHGYLYADWTVLLQESNTDSTKWMNAARKFPK